MEVIYLIQCTSPFFTQFLRTE